MLSQRPLLLFPALLLIACSGNSTPTPKPAASHRDGPFEVTETVLHTLAPEDVSNIHISPHGRVWTVGVRARGTDLAPHQQGVCQQLIANGAVGPQFDAIRLQRAVYAPAASVQYLDLFSGDGKHFAYLGHRKDQDIFVFDHVEGTPVARISDDFVRLGQTNGFLYVAMPKSGVHIVHIVHNGKSFGPYAQVSELAISDDGQHFAAIATPADPEIDGQTPSLILDGNAVYTGNIHHLVLSPSGKRCAFAEGMPQQQKTLIVGADPAEYPFNIPPRSFSPDDRHLVSLGAGMLAIDGRLLLAGKFDGGDISFSPDARFLRLAAPAESAVLALDGSRVARIAGWAFFHKHSDRYVLFTQIPNTRGRDSAPTNQVLQFGPGRRTPEIGSINALPTFLPGGQAVFTMLTQDEEQKLQSGPVAFPAYIEDTVHPALNTLWMAGSPDGRAYVAPLGDDPQTGTVFYANGVRTTTAYSRILAPLEFTASDTCTAFVIKDASLVRLDMKIVDPLPNPPAIGAAFKPELQALTPVQVWREQHPGRSGTVAPTGPCALFTREDHLRALVSNYHSQGKNPHTTFNILQQSGQEWALSDRIDADDKPERLAAVIIGDAHYIATSSHIDLSNGGQQVKLWNWRDGQCRSEFSAANDYHHDVTYNLGVSGGQPLLVYTFLSTDKPVPEEIRCARRDPAGKWIEEKLAPPPIGTAEPFDHFEFPANPAGPPTVIVFTRTRPVGIAQLGPQGWTYAVADREQTAVPDFGATPFITANGASVTLRLNGKWLETPLVAAPRKVKGASVALIAGKPAVAAVLDDDQLHYRIFHDNAWDDTIVGFSNPAATYVHPVLIDVQGEPVIFLWAQYASAGSGDLTILRPPPTPNP